MQLINSVFSMSARWFAIVVSLVISTSVSVGQAYFTNQSLLDVAYDPVRDALYFQYVTNQEDNIYRLSKVFNQPVESVYAVNPTVKHGQKLPVLTTVNIPIDRSQIYTGKDVRGNKDFHFVPIYYTVKPRETLFRIAKVYFSQAIEDMKYRNVLTSNSLDTGQKLLVGWLKIPISSKKAESKKITEVPVKKEPQAIKTEVKPSIATKTPDQPKINDLDVTISIDSMIEDYKTMRGIAYWDKSNADSKMRFVMSNMARVNSEIELTNPVTRRKVRAKVVGPIPAGTYKEDVSILLSPRVAKSLGALDARFMVEIKYLPN